MCESCLTSISSVDLKAKIHLMINDERVKETPSMELNKNSIWNIDQIIKALKSNWHKLAQAIKAEKKIEAIIIYWVWLKYTSFDDGSELRVLVAHFDMNS